MGLGRWMWLVVGGFMLVSGMSDAVYAALSPSVNTSQIRDFTRVTFTWPEQVRFRVAPQGNQVVLQFNKATDLNLGAIRAGLGPRLKGAAMSGDGMSVTLTFDKPYRVRHFISGNANGIDVMGAPSQATQPAPPPAPAPEPKVAAAPPAAPPAAEPKPTPPPAAKVVAPPAPPPAAKPIEKPAPKSEPVATPKPAAAPAPEPALQPAPTAEQPPVPVAPAPAPAATPSPAPAAATAPPAPPAAAAVQATPVAPVAEPKSAPIAAPAAAETPASEPKAPEAAATAASADPATPPAATPVPVSPVAPAAPETPQPEAAPSETPAAEGNATEAQPTEATAAEAPVAGEIPAEALPAKPAPEDPYKPTLPKPDAPADSAKAIAPDEEDAAPAKAPAAAPPAAAAPVDPNRPFIVTSRVMPTGTEINFPWMKRTAAAVFARGDVLWVVFNAKENIKLTLLQSILPASVTQVELMEHPTHTILRMQTDGTAYAKVSRSPGSMEWLVTLSQYKQIPKILTALSPQPGLRNANITVSTLEYSPPITITDPVVGDELVIAPFFTVGEGVYPAREVPQLSILETAQGLAIVRKADLATIKPLRNGLRISAKDGLSISENLPQLALEELESVISQQSIWFPYDSWKAEPGTFAQTRQELEQKLIGAGDVRANSVRQKLAQLYLSEGFASEAMGWLELIKAKDPVFYAERQLASMHGAANFLMDRFDAADADFRSPELNDRTEQKLWLEALKILQESRPRFDYVNYYKAYISKYPPALREKLAILAADNYINRKSYSKALATFDTLSESGISPRLMPYVDFLLGKISAETKKYKTAEALWKPLTDASHDRFIRARAEFALVSMQYGRGKISLKEAIDRLDRLRVVWRGDSLELSLLNYLGQLYIDDHNYLDGLRAWKELKTQFPTSPILPDVAAEMARTFKRLFAENEADKLQPLQALSIFYEFRDLVPIGEEGDAMIQGLADRLASVDLLDRAAALLEHQIKFRQEKQARSKLGAQLALIYLLNKHPDRAVAILEVTGYGENPPELQRKRTHIGAMALAETGNPAGAIEMLSSDLSRDAAILKLNIFWKQRQWRDVISTAESLLSDRADVTQPLDDAETEYLMQLAIAYMFERDTSQLQYLRTYFSPLLKDGPNKEIFDFVTDASGPIDPKKMEQVTQQIGRIESFMQTYRKRVNEGGLSGALDAGIDKPTIAKQPTTEPAT